MDNAVVVVFWNVGAFLWISGVAAQNAGSSCEQIHLVPVGEHDPVEEHCLEVGVEGDLVAVVVAAAAVVEVQVHYWIVIVAAEVVVVAVAAAAAVVVAAVAVEEVNYETHPDDDDC